MWINKKDTDSQNGSENMVFFFWLQEAELTIKDWHILEWGKCFIMATEIKPGLYPTLQIRNIVINNISKILKILFLFFSRTASKQFQYEGQ